MSVSVQSSNTDSTCSPLEPGSPSIDTELKSDVSSNTAVDTGLSISPRNRLDSTIERYLGEDAGGMDRTQDRIAETVGEFNPDTSNSYVGGLVDGTTDFGKGFIQGVGGAFSAPGAVYDGIKEWRDDDYDYSLSFYDQMERHTDDKSISRYLGEAAGLTAGATAIYQQPGLLLAGVGRNGRHLGERKVHEKGRDLFYNEEQPAAS